VCLSSSLFLLRLRRALPFVTNLLQEHKRTHTQMFVLKLNYDGDTRRATFLNESKPDYVLLEKVRHSLHEDRKRSGGGDFDMF